MRTNERRGGVERKILLSILWVGITPITIALIIGYAVVHESQRKAVEHTLATAAQKTATGLKFVLDARLRVIDTLSRDSAVVDALASGGELSRGEREAFLTRLAREGRDREGGPSVHSLFDRNGRLILTTGDLSEEDSRHATWPATITGPRFVTFRESVGQGRFTARTVAPVFSPQTSECIGFVAEDQEVSTLLGFALAQDKQGKGDMLGADVYQMAYISEMLRFMCYRDPELSPELRMEALDERLETRLMLPTADGHGSQPVGDALRLNGYNTRNTAIDVLLAYYPSYGRPDSFQMYVVVYRPTAAVFATINLWALFSMLGSALVIGLFCVIAYRHVHNNIVRPVALLNEGAQIIRQGDLDLKLKIGTGDEIEELASSFNRMALALKNNIGQLEDSEEKYRSLVTSMREGVYQTDINGDITFINPAGAEVFGFEEPKAALGRSIRELFLDELDFVWMSEELGRHAFVERTRMWMKRVGEQAICVELSANRVLDDEDRIIGTEGIFRDVTTSVRLEQEARERSERIAAINQIANVINSSLEAGRLHESLVVEVKKLVNFDFAAVALEDGQGESFEWRQLWPQQEGRPAMQPADNLEEFCAAWVAHHRRYLLIDNLHEENAQGANAQGANAPFAREFPETIHSCLCIPLYATGFGSSRTHVIGSLNLGAAAASAFSKHDIEVLQQMAPHVAVAMRNARLLESLQHSLDEVTLAREELHEANAQLKTLDEMKTNLLSNVSHELRTPLVAVMGYTDMIFNGKVGPINEVQSEYLGIILRNVEKLVTLIENLLDFSRLHQGAERLVFDTFDIVDCARMSMQIVKPVADGRDIHTHLDASDEAILVEGDKGKVSQVFNNLLSNAVKFNRNGGEIVLAIRRQDGLVEVSVSDTGIGIPQEALDKIFTRFYQYDSSSTRKYGGTGIGLAIAQDIVRMHGGNITVTSEPEKGSVFHFSLPSSMHEEGQPPKAGQPGSALPLPPETRLVLALITQDRALSVQVRDVLASENIEVIQASSAERATALVAKYQPDCILVDLEAARNGHMLLDDLLAPESPLSDPSSPTPVIILTNDDALYEQYRSAVASRVVRSFRKSSLLSGIRLALSQTLPLGQRLGNRILCVDDDPEVGVFITRCLDADEYEVDSCATGREALDRLASHEYGVVLLDIAMPGMDGWETCRRIKSDASLTGIKVCMVTAKPIDSSTRQLQEVGADGLLLKPFKPEELIDLVQDLVAPGTGRGEAQGKAATTAEDA